MRLIRFRIIPVYLLVFCLVFFPWLFAARSEGPLRIIQVPKNQPQVEKILESLQLEVLQEITDSYLLRVERKELSNLSQLGVKWKPLTLCQQKKIYLLARINNQDELIELKKNFRAIYLERNDYLLIADQPLSLEYLPLTVKVRRLPERGLTFAAKKPLPEQYLWRQVFDQLYQQLANAVSPDNLRAYVTDLQNFNTRYAYTVNCLQAAQYLYNFFAGLGLQPRFQDFTWNGYSCRNVIAEIPGLIYPEQVVILCAHYDSISNQRWTLAPGADDNASGTAAVMEAARILVNYPLDFTVRFILFSAEELGLIGSQFYVQNQLSPQERVIAVINLDMIAYADRLPEDLDVIGNFNSSWLVDRLISIANSYGVVAGKKIIDPSFVYSDHASFWDRGIDAVCAIEDANVPNPYYHQTSDTVDTLNFDFYQASTRSGLVTSADLGQLQRPGFPSTPRNFNLRISVYASIFNYLKKVQLSWESVPGVIGYNVYRSNYSHGNYQKINSAPLSTTEYVDTLFPGDMPYYYVVTAVDSLNRESNYSRELVVLPGVSASTTASNLFVNIFRR